MTKKPSFILGGGGFFAALLLCLLAVGAGAYFLVFRAAPAEDETTREVTLAPAEQPELPPAAETVSGAEIAQPPEMPEEETPSVGSAPAAAVIARAPSLIVTPVSGQVVTAFSVDQLLYNETLEDWRIHDGIDISAAQGTKVLSACAGTVLTVEADDLLGTTVVVGHDGGYQTTYANLQAAPAVKKGDAVSAGAVLGAVGSTSLSERSEGPHLHFSVAKDGDAVDPEEFLDR